MEVFLLVKNLRIFHHKGKGGVIMPVELFVHRQDTKGKVSSEKLATLPLFSHAVWELDPVKKDTLIVDPAIDHLALDYRVRLGGNILSRRGLIPEGSGLTVRLDPYGLGRAELGRGPRGERVLLEVRTEALAEPIFEGGALVGFKPNPNFLNGVV